MADSKFSLGSMMRDNNRLTGVKKRQQIAAASRAVFVWVAIAAAALSFCAVTVQYLYVKWDHNNKVLDAKYKAASTLSQNITNASSLTDEVHKLDANQDLASVKTNPTDPNTKSVLDALPTTFDPAALATSLQQVVLSQSGVSIESIGVPQELQATDASAQAAITATPQPMTFSFVVSGNYDKIQHMVLDMERTIRAIKINTITLTGSDSNLRASCEATTYYQPAKTVTVKEKAIK